MKKLTFDNRLKKALTAEENYWYSLCESVNDKCNFGQSYTSITDTTRIFYFAKTNTVVLYDSPNGYKESFKNPSLALREIESWINSSIAESQNRIAEDAEYQNGLSEVSA